MSLMINYNAFADLVRQTVMLRSSPARFRRVEQLLDAEQPRLLEDVEHKLTECLKASGLPQEVAAQSAFLFVSKCAAHYQSCS